MTAEKIVELKIENYDVDVKKQCEEYLNYLKRYTKGAIDIKCTYCPMVIRFNVIYAPGTCIYEKLGKSKRNYQEKADKVFCNIKGYTYNVHAYQNGCMLVIDIPLSVQQLNYDGTKYVFEEEK